MLCYRCQGSGKYLGNGMMMTKCLICENGHVKEESSGVIDRRSKSYITAIKDIMAINPEITREEAVKMFDKEYEKI